MRKSTPFLAILGAVILLGLVVLVARAVRSGGYFSTTLTGKVRADITTIEFAMTEYAERNGEQYPDSIELLVVRDVNGHTFLNMTRVPRDPWGREYLYDPPANPGARPRIWSHGRDGTPGGEDENLDVDNWMLR